MFHLRYEPEPELAQQTPDTSEKSPVLESDITVSADESVAEPILQTVSITVLGPDGILIYSVDAEHREGITVLDLLLETAKEKNIPAVYTGSKSAAYITSIGGYAEKQYGPSSGWIYTVNGESVMRPCGKYILNPNDKVEWKYITEF